VPVAIHTVKIAFNTGYQAANAGEAVEGPSSSSSTSWSAIFHGLDERFATKLVQDFVQDAVSTHQNPDSTAANFAETSSNDNSLD
jgi:hypothetical protein